MRRSAHKTAYGLAALGRGEDSMLVHMTPREVAGLQKIAMDHGGSLTINPQTGLPEAGFLKSILPALAGIGLSFIPGIGPLAAAGISGLATKDWKQGLLAALSAGAASGATRGLAGLGAEAAKAKLTEETAKGLTGEVLRTAGQKAAEQGAKSFLGNLTAGAGQLFGGGAGTTAGMTALGGKLGLGALAAPMVYEAAKPPKYKMPEEAEGSKFKYLTGVKYRPGMYNPNAGFGESPFTEQGYDYGESEYSETYPGYAEGGQVNPQQDLQAYYQSMLAPPAPAASTASADIMNYINQVNQSLKPAAPVTPTTPAPTTPAPTTPAPTIPGLPPGFDISKIPGFNFMGINLAGLAGLGGGSGGAYKYDPATQAFTNAGFTPPVVPKTPTSIANTEYKYDPATQSFTGAVDRKRDRGVGGVNRYAAGGRLLSGGGDGMSDSIPAMIDGPKPQQARLADGEFVVPADVVSHLGNGSTKAGANQLYTMMDKVRQARTGRAKQAPAINPNKYLA